VYNFQLTPFGRVLVAFSQEKICFLGFVVTTSEDLELEFLRFFSLATKNTLLNFDLGFWTKKAHALDDFAVPGTSFQRSVWVELLKIPHGQTVTYSQVAARLGKSTAVRAVARAIGANFVSMLIPCHRVVGKNGKLTGYRWGLEAK
jgi:AraC family transcriptional regulator of adaptative response/methylated-DNA-[protein]-cysteine methyltransferase